MRSARKISILHQREYFISDIESILFPKFTRILKFTASGRPRSTLLVRFIGPWAMATKGLVSHPSSHKFFLTYCSIVVFEDLKADGTENPALHYYQQNQAARVYGKSKEIFSANNFLINLFNIYKYWAISNFVTFTLLVPQIESKSRSGTKYKTSVIIRKRIIRT